MPGAADRMGWVVAGATRCVRRSDRFPMSPCTQLLLGTTDEDQEKLCAMGAQDGKGKFHVTATSVELTTTVQAIADDCKLLKGSVSNIGGVSRKKAYTKIMLEYVKHF